MHPQYITEGDYDDIGLIELEKPVEFNHILKPACLPSPRDTEIPDTLIASGWGTTVYEGNTSRILLEVNLPHVEKSACEQKTQTIAVNGVRDSQLCFGGVKGQDTCQGDSGGPLQGHSKNVYCSYTIYGVTSLGEECGLKTPALYTRVSHYLDWIEGIVWPNQTSYQ